MSRALRFASPLLLTLGLLPFAVQGCGDSSGGEGGADDATSAKGTTSGGVDPFCGDRITDPSIGEECDDGNQNDDDDCLSDCSKAKCGDAVIRAGYEDCDDGNTIDTDACPSTCFNATCGDAFVWAGHEDCDDGNEEDDDACSSTCLGGSGCGNGQQEANEECDDGNNSNADACTNACKTAICGDGYAQIGIEECDDGNAINNDNCANDCTNNDLVNATCPGTPVPVAGGTSTSVGADLTLTTSSYQGTCGGLGSDVVWAVKPDMDGVLYLSLAGEESAMDPVLYVRGGACEDGPELACADATLPGGVETAVVPVLGGQTYYVFADLYDPMAMSGNITLSVDLLTQTPGDDCPGINLPITGFNTPAQYSGNTAGAMADRTGTGLCDSPGTKDVVIQVTPPSSGRLAVALDPSFDASLYIRTSCTSPASQLVCSEMGNSGELEVATFDVTGGNTYYIIVDGWDGDAGAFNVEVTLLDPG